MIFCQDFNSSGRVSNECLERVLQPERVQKDSIDPCGQYIRPSLKHIRQAVDGRRLSAAQCRYAQPLKRCLKPFGRKSHHIAITALDALDDAGTIFLVAYAPVLSQLPERLVLQIVLIVPAVLLIRGPRIGRDFG